MRFVCEERGDTIKRNLCRDESLRPVLITARQHRACGEPSEGESVSGTMEQSHSEIKMDRERLPSGMVRLVHLRTTVQPLGHPVGWSGCRTASGMYEDGRGGCLRILMSVSRIRDTMKGDQASFVLGTGTLVQCFDADALLVRGVQKGCRETMKNRRGNASCRVRKNATSVTKQRRIR